MSFVSVRYDRITVGHALLLELEDSWSLETRFVQVEVLLFIKESGPISEENPDLGQLSNSRLQKLQIFQLVGYRVDTERRTRAFGITFYPLSPAQRPRRFARQLGFIPK
jgi:hypothetical protein